MEYLTDEEQLSDINKENLARYYKWNMLKSRL